MATATYEQLTGIEKQEVRMFGCTEVQLREAVEHSINFRHGNAPKMVMSLISDAQEELEFDVDTARQTLNRAKWIISEYFSENK